MCFVPNTLDGNPLLESDNSPLTQRRNKEKGMAVSVAIRDTTSCSNKKLLRMKRNNPIMERKRVEQKIPFHFYFLPE